MSFPGPSLTPFQVISISIFSMMPLEDDEMDSNRIRHTSIEYRNVARPKNEVGHYGGQVVYTTLAINGSRWNV